MKKFEKDKLYVVSSKRYARDMLRIHLEYYKNGESTIEDYFQGKECTKTHAKEYSGRIIKFYTKEEAQTIMTNYYKRLYGTLSSDEHGRIAHFKDGFYFKTHYGSLMKAYPEWAKCIG